MGARYEPNADQSKLSSAITIRIIKAPLLPSICEVEAIAKLVEAIRDPRPRARGKTVWPGRAERAADDAGEKMPEARAVTIVMADFAHRNMFCPR